MKRLFLVSLSLLLLFSCSSVKVVEDSDTASSLYYKNALESKESTENRYNYVYYLYMEGDYENCITQCDYALTMYSGYTRFLKLRALCERTTGDKEKYLLSLNEILDYEPHDEELRDLYTDALLESGKTEDAALFAEETIIYYPENKKAISILAGESSFYSFLNSLNEEASKAEISDSQV